MNTYIRIHIYIYILGSISLSLLVPFVHQPFDVLIALIRQMYVDVSMTRDTVCIHGQVMVTHCPPEKVLIEWTTDPITDMVADSIVALTMHAQCSPASFKVSFLTRRLYLSIYIYLSISISIYIYLHLDRNQKTSILHLLLLLFMIIIIKCQWQMNNSRRHRS
jgi:hypothetical protein